MRLSSDLRGPEKALGLAGLKGEGSGGVIYVTHVVSVLEWL